MERVWWTRASENVGLGFGQDEAEVVLAVAAEGECAVVLAEDGCVVFLLGAFGDVDVAVAHALDAAVGEEGFHFDVLGAHEVEGVESRAVMCQRMTAISSSERSRPRRRRGCLCCYTIGRQKGTIEENTVYYIPCFWLCRRS